VGRLLGVRPVDEAGERRFATVAHVATGVGLGASRGLLEVAGLRDVRATLPAQLAIVLTPELVAAPALGATEPPWRWGIAETAISLVHHVVYAAATDAAYRALAR
jgi:hypothetical protein